MDFKISCKYSFRNYNCWDYVCDIREQAGVATKQYYHTDVSSAFDTIASEMDKLGHGLVRVLSPENFDIVIVNKVGKKRPVYHCGIYYNGLVVHNSMNLKQVISESYRAFTSNYDEASLWR